MCEERWSLRYFCRNHEQNYLLEESLSFLHNMPIYYPSGKYKFSILSFLEYCYAVAFVHDVLCMLKGCLVHDGNMHKIFSVLNFTIICIKNFTCNNTTFSISFLNEILFLHQTFSFKNNIIDCI